MIGGITFSYFMWRSTKAATDDALFKLYTYFPLINTIIGAIVSMELFAKNIW